MQIDEPLLRLDNDPFYIEIWAYMLGQLRIKIVPKPTEHDRYPCSLREM